MFLDDLVDAVVAVILGRASEELAIKIDDGVVAAHVNLPRRHNQMSVAGIDGGKSGEILVVHGAAITSVQAADRVYVFEFPQPEQSLLQLLLEGWSTIALERGHEIPRGED
jgi:hypothetical protein